MRSPDSESDRAPLVVNEDCPACGSRLQLRRRRADGISFVSCSTWPACSFAEAFDERQARMAKRISQLEAEVIDLEVEITGLNAELAVAGPGDAFVEKELRRLIFEFHPDRNGDDPLAAKVTGALTELRARLRGLS